MLFFYHYLSLNEHGGLRCLGLSRHRSTGLGHRDGRVPHSLVVLELLVGPHACRSGLHHWLRWHSLSHYGDLHVGPGSHAGGRLSHAGASGTSGPGAELGVARHIDMVGAGSTLVLGSPSGLLNWVGNSLVGAAASHLTHASLAGVGVEEPLWLRDVGHVKSGSRLGESHLAEEKTRKQLISRIKNTTLTKLIFCCCKSASKVVIIHSQVKHGYGHHFEGTKN